MDSEKKHDFRDEMPVGFGMALAQNEPAMERFAALSDDGKRGLLNRARQVKTKDEMDNLIASLAAAPLTGHSVLDEKGRG